MGRLEAVHHVVPLARVIRSGFAESVHHGALVVLDSDGRPLISAGDVTGPIFPRSLVVRAGQGPPRISGGEVPGPISPRPSNKPLQAVGMLRAGLDPNQALPGELLALAQSSHSGQSFHLAGVRRILLTAGLTDA